MKYMLLATCCFYAFSTLAVDSNIPRNQTNLQQTINGLGIPSLNRSERRAILNGNKSKYNQSPSHLGYKGLKNRKKK